MKTQIQTKIEALTQQGEQIRQEIEELILSLPDNPRIKRINNSPNCFILNSSDLGACWSPEYHDFKKAYQIIYDELEKKPLANMVPFLTEISKRGHFRIPSQGYTHYLHPDVQKHLQELIS